MPARTADGSPLNAHLPLSPCPPVPLPFFFISLRRRALAPLAWLRALAARRAVARSGPAVRLPSWSTPRRPPGTRCGCRRSRAAWPHLGTGAARCAPHHGSGVARARRARRIGWYARARADRQMGGAVPLIRTGAQPLVLVQNIVQATVHRRRHGLAGAVGIRLAWPCRPGSAAGVRRPSPWRTIELR